MISNVKWREEVRKETFEKAKVKMQAEEEQLKKEQASAIKFFIFLIKFFFNNYFRPKFGSITTSAASVSQRLQTKRQTLQRSHDYMEKSFAKKR